jgi:hypothetical protein
MDPAPQLSNLPALQSKKQGTIENEKIDRAANTAVAAICFDDGERACG